MQKRHFSLAPTVTALAVVAGIAAVSLFVQPRPANAIGTSPEQLLQQQRAQQGFKIAPVPLNMEGLDPGLVGYGSYLVNGVGGCNDCHTNPTFLDGGDPYKGQAAKPNTAAYLAGGTEFGPFKSRNITPNPKEGNLPAGLTFDAFVTVMRTGADPDKKHPEVSPLLQVMPWPMYAGMTDYDLRAMYEYLRAVPPVEANRDDEE